MTQTEVRERLDAAGVRPNRKLGQNFLCDPRVAAEIVEALDLGEGDSVVEVGPGLGALTEHLVGRVARLELVEFDHRLAEALEHRFADRVDVEVTRDDAVQWDARGQYGRQPVKLIGNLPYSSGTAIMRHLLEPPTPFASAVLMLQTEVAERLQAKPRTKAYGVLSLQFQLTWKIESVRMVPPEVFWPRPAVESSVIVLRPRSQKDWPVFSRRRFQRLVKQGFVQRRKQLRKALGLESELWLEMAAELGVSETARAEELSVQQWVNLSRRLSLVEGELSEAGAQQIDELFDEVNEADEAIGQATRTQIHAQNLRHRAAHGLVINKVGEVLLQLRSVHKDRNGGLWDSSISGHLDAGEHYVEAMAREAAEEINLSLAPEDWQLLGKLGCSEQTGWEFIEVFFTRVQKTKTLRGCAAEIDALLWLRPEVVDKWLQRSPEQFSPAFALVWALAREKLLTEN